METEEKKADLKDQKSKDKPSGKGRKFDRNRRNPRDKFVKKEKFNEPSWYFKFPNLMNTLARVPFNHRSGAIVNYHVGQSANPIDALLDPVMVLDILPNPGHSISMDSGINIMANATWKMLHRRFRGTHNYQSADLGIIQFCIQDLFTSIAEAERVYGLLYLYKLNNKLVPIDLLYALGVDPNTFVDLASYRAKINEMIIRCKTLCLVRGYSFLEHNLFLFSNVFKDKDCARAQLIAFHKAGFWLYEPTASTGSAAKFAYNTTPEKLTVGSKVYFLRTADSIITDIKMQMDRLLTDDDVDDVCSDILAFYGNKEDAADLVKLAALPEDYIVEPTYSLDVLKQVHNSTCCSEPRRTWKGSVGVADAEQGKFVNQAVPQLGITDQEKYLWIHQVNNTIIFTLGYIDGTLSKVNTTSERMWGSYNPTIHRTASPLIDDDVDEPSCEEVVEITRLMSITSVENITSGSSTYYRLNYDSFPTTVVMGVVLFKPELAAQVPTYGQSQDPLAPVSVSFGTNPMIEVFRTSLSVIVTLMTRFDWAPIFYYTNMGYVLVIADLDNYRAINKAVLDPIHQVAAQSEFKNPIVDQILSE